MSVTRHPERITVKLSSENFLRLARALRDDTSFEQFGDGVVAGIERDRPYWVKAQVEPIMALILDEKKGGEVHG